MRLQDLNKTIHIAVIGGNGFLGRSVIHRLSGYKNLRIFSLDKREHNVWIDTSKSKAIIQQIQADISNEDYIKTWLISNPVDIIIFTAGYENPTDGLGRTIDDTKALLGLNKTLQALQFMDLESNEDKPYFLYISSWSVYGNQKTKLISETSKEYPKNYVGINKVLAEDLVKRYCTKFNIPWCILRPTEIYGKYDYKELIDQSFWHGYLIYYLDKIIKREYKLEVWSPKTHIDLVNINYFTALVRDLITNRITGIYNVASGQTIKISELVTKILDLYGEKDNFKISISNKLKIEDMKLDTTAVSNILPYPQEKYILEDFIRDYIAVRRFEIGNLMAIEKALMEPVIIDPTTQKAVEAYELRKQQRKLDYQKIKEIAGDEFFKIKIGNIQDRAKELLNLPDMADTTKLENLKKETEERNKLLFTETGITKESI
jgi:UDP-glucose 4-epimerase